MRTLRNCTLERLEQRELPSGVTAETCVYAAGTASTATVYNLGGMVQFEVAPYGDGFSGGVRTAVADVDGDGVPDLITAPGPGAPVQVRVFSGVNGRPLGSFLGFEESFTGGGYVAAADLDKDGKAEIVVTPDQGGGPRVRVLSGASGYQVLADFFGLDVPDFRGGARVATGDVNGDGVSDVLVGAGIGGGPQVAVFDGTGVAAGDPQRLMSDFFVFDKTLRNGVYLAAGDLNGDKFADLVFGAGPGGGPRVYAVDAAEFVRTGGAVRKELVNTFAFSPSLRDGVRVAAGDVTGDGVTDLLVGSGADGGGQLRVFASPDYTRPRTDLSVSASSAGAFPAVATETSLSPLAGDYLRWKPKPTPPSHSRGQSLRVPTAPSGLSATAVSDTGIDLAWADNSSNETGFVVERATDAAFTLSDAVTDVGENATSLTVTGLSAGTTYYFRVRAVNADGESTDSNTASATTATPIVPPPASPPPVTPPPPVATPPAAPGDLTASVVSDTGIDLAWTDNSANETGFVVEQAADTAFTQQVVSSNLGADTTSLTVTGLSAGTTYYFRVRAINADGASADSNTTSATTAPPIVPPPASPPPVTPPPPASPPPPPAATPPAAPSGLTAAVVSTSRIDLAWTDNSSNETGFTVERAADPAFTQQVVSVGGGADATGLSFTGLSAGTTYYFRVRAVNADGDSADSNTASATTIAPSEPLPGADSPTGRNPRLMWTRQQQAVWNRMRAENHPWWVLVKNNADLTGTANERYGDYGQWATLVYQMTGDTAYAAKAWSKLSTWMGQLPAWGKNGSREYFAEFVMLYDWLYPALTTAQRATYIDTMNMWGDAVLQPNGGGWGTRTGDSDQVIGQYFGLALLDVATAPDNPRAGTFLSRSWDTGYAIKTVGGLDATGVNRETMRNEISSYIQAAEGGEWIESTDYNPGTLKLLIMGVQGVKTATGVDHFPEVTRFLKQAALAQIHELSGDLQASYQWGDEEHPRDLKLYDRVTLLGMLAGVTQDDPQVGPYVNRLVADFVAKYGAVGWGTAEPWARLFYFYNPYAPQADWRTGLPAVHYAAGIGRLDVHSDWGTDGSYFGAHMPNRLSVDHEVGYFGDFQLYRNGEWAITRPIGYSGPAISGESANTMVIAGLSSMFDRAVVAEDDATDGSWAYIAGTTGGQYYWPDRYDPPPAFLHEWTRSIFYLPSTDDKSDTIITFDRVDADDPTTLPKFDRYYDTEQTAITSAPGLKQWIIHTPVTPTLTPGAITWTTAGGQEVRVSTLQPLNQTRTVYNEDDLWPNPPYWNFYDSEKNYQVRVVPTTEQQWDTFLNVTQVSDPGTALTNVGVRSAGGEASGVLVQRGGLADALVMFGAQQGTRVLSTGYSMNWTAGASGTDLYLVDLDASKTWSVQVNGGAATPLTVSSQGVAQLTVAGTGAQSVQLIAV
ncbi:MAG TPA: fibronectin type III domain-containing protein [Fimbriiglobus sp.]|nr:fibronectin type III domain-containing protein [Fimbriiglobus sp.]